MRFISKVKRCLTKETNVTAGMVAHFEDNRELNSKELKQAEILCIRAVQADSLPNEISYLKKLQQATP